MGFVVIVTTLAVIGLLSRIALWGARSDSGPSLDRLEQGRPWERPTGGLRGVMEAAGQGAGAAPVVLTSLAAGASATLLAGGELHGPLLLGTVLVAAWIPFGWLGWDRSRRALQATEALPSALRGIGRLAASGHGLGACLREARGNIAGPLGLEVTRATREMEAGRPLGDALRAVADRLPDSPDVRIAIEAMLLSDESSGDLPALVGRLEETLTLRLASWREARASTLQARLSAGVVVVVALLGVGLVYLAVPEYLERLWTDPTGRVIAQAATSWFALGLFVVGVLIRSRP